MSRRGAFRCCGPGTLCERFLGVGLLIRMVVGLPLGAPDSGGKVFIQGEFVGIRWLRWLGSIVTFEAFVAV
jgi:hypothetical protein